MVDVGLPLQPPVDGEDAVLDRHAITGQADDALDGERPPSGALKTTRSPRRGDAEAIGELLDEHVSPGRSVGAMLSDGIANGSADVGAQQQRDRQQEQGADGQQAGARSARTDRRSQPSPGTGGALRTLSGMNGTPIVHVRVLGGLMAAVCARHGLRRRRQRAGPVLPPRARPPRPPERVQRAPALPSPPAACRARRAGPPSAAVAAIPAGRPSRRRPSRGPSGMPAVRLTRYISIVARLVQMPVWTIHAARPQRERTTSAHSPTAAPRRTSVAPPLVEVLRRDADVDPAARHGEPGMVAEHGRAVRRPGAGRGRRPEPHGLHA